MRITGTLRALDSTLGAVRVEDVYDTGIDDLWDACTDPARLARWIAEVSGDLRLGGEFAARFTSGWEGRGRVEVCEPPRRLLVSTREDGSGTDQVIEATLTPDGDRTVLVVEERGLPVEQLAAYGAGWQAHLGDLASYLAGAEPAGFVPQWQDLVPHYRTLPVGS